MMRETKLGLVVASSFVALTAVVVVGRLKQKTEAPPNAKPVAGTAVLTPPQAPPRQVPPVSAPAPTIPAGGFAVPPGAPSVIPAAAVSAATPLQPNEGSARAGDSVMGMGVAPPRPAPPAPGGRTTADGMPDIPLPGAAGTQLAQEAPPPLPAVTPSPKPPVPQPIGGGGDLSTPPTGTSGAAVVPVPGGTNVGGASAPPPPAVTPNGQLSLPPPNTLIGNSGQPAPPAPPAAVVSDAKKEKKEKKETPAALSAVPGAPLPSAPTPGAIPAPAALPDNNGLSAVSPPPAPLPPVVAPSGKPSFETPGGMAVPPVPAPSSGAGNTDGMPSPRVFPASAGEVKKDEKERPKDPPGGLLAVPSAPPSIAPPPPSMTNPPPAPLPIGAPDSKGPSTVNPPAPVAPLPGSGFGDSKPAAEPQPKEQGFPTPAGPQPSGSVNGGRSEQFGNPTSVAQVDLGGREKGNSLSAGNATDVRPVPAPPAAAATDPGAPPPLGATGNVASRPISVPAPVVAPKAAVPGPPQVTVYDKQGYTCTADDTSFEILSKRFYNTERYAQALLRYNLEYPPGSAELRESGKPRPGMRVYFPPTHILEENYGKFISGITPLAPVAPGQRTTSTELSSPAVGGGERAAVAVPVPSVRSGNVMPAGAQTAPGGTKLYRVQASAGEPMYLIAQQKLGDPNRWNEILRMNPNLLPERPVPQGTLVVLPGDARVE